MKKLVLLVFSMVAVASLVAAEADVDGRPYEFVWANRVADDRPVLLPLTETAGWRVECQDAVARFERTTQHKLFGEGVARLVYRSAGKKPQIVLRPPTPVAITDAFDTVSLWIYGNNVSYARDKTTPSVTVTALFVDGAGKPFSVPVLTIHHLEWFLAQRRLTTDLRVRTAAGGCVFTGFSVTGGTNEQDRQIEFTSFAAYREELKPLTCAARPKRPNRVFPTAPAGVNTGAGELAFPNRALGVVPEPKATEVEFRLPSSNVDWDGLAVRVKGGAWRRFADGAGVYSVTTQGPKRVARADVKVNWHVEGQSLVADVQGPADIAEVRFGALADFPAAKLFTVPYLSYSMTGAFNRPWVAVLDLEGTSYFCSATMDWTQSNATEPWCEAMRFDGLPSVHGGVRYAPKTDGTRNPCYERFVWSFAPEMADVLPVIPNPPSPYRNLTAEYQWCHMGASKNRQRDKDYWKNRHRRGLKKVFIGDHEVCMRDGNESFTFRTKAAPGKGGDEGMRDFTRYMIDELGYLYGPYNNYTDFATVNEYWHADHMTRTADGNLLPAWNRCYAPKPTWAVEMCEKIVPVLQEKFRFNSGYCDVHTCVSPWSRCDYDARVPGGGTFAGTFYAYGELLGLQRKFWGGPVYSEGGIHFLYCGLDDGNFAQDQGYGLDTNPWIVDFDLLRLHPLANNFGMGYPRMFSRDPNFEKTPNWLDRFLTATVAFGHIGYFLTGRPDDEEQGYWMLQPLQSHYAKADVATIAYADEKGTLLPSAAGLATGAYTRSQVAVTYQDGTRVFANGSVDGDDWRLDAHGTRVVLPANGWYGISGDGRVVSMSAAVPTTDHSYVRADVCVGPESVYVDGRGQFFDSGFGATDGRLIRLLEKDGKEEILLRHTKQAVLPYAATKVVMLNEAGAEIGSATWTVEGGNTRLTADGKAFSYRATRPQGWQMPSAGTLVKAFAVPAGWQPPVREKKGTPRFTLPKLSVTGMAYRGGPETPILASSGAGVGRPHDPVEGVVKKDGIFMHPPFRGGTGYTFQRWRLGLPKDPLVFSASVGKIDRTSRGDGTLYKIVVEDLKGKRTVLAELQTNEHRWSKLTADLSPWAGQTVFLMLVADAGPADNTDSDHSTWADLEFHPVSPSSARDLRATWEGQEIKEETCRVSAVPFNRVWPGYQRSQVQTKLARFVSFDVERPGTFACPLPAGATQARIRPFRRDQGTVSNGVLTTRIERPEQFVIEAGGTEIHVFANPPWHYVPRKGDRYFGPGEHEAGAIIPRSGERIVLDRGAVVYGNFVLAGVTNVTIEGRGILDTSRIARVQPDWPGVRHLETCGIPGVNSVWGTAPVYANRCSGIFLSGLVFRDAPRWTMNLVDSSDITIDGVKLVGMWRYNSDGIDICACARTVIRNSFLRTFDDCVIARPQIGPHERTPLHDMVVSNCVLWCDWGANLKVQHAERAGTMSQIRFRDLDCVNVDTKGIWLTTRWGSENSLIRDVTFDDLRFDVPADRLRNQYQKTDETVFTPRLNDTLTFAQVDAYSLGRPAPNQGRPGKMAPNLFRFDYSDLAFRQFRVYDRPGHLIDAASPLKTKISFKTKVPRHTIRNVVLSGLPDRTTVEQEGNVIGLRREIDFQARIDAAAKAGGGRVVVPAGRHVTPELHLRSNVELHLERGAVLLGSPRADDYTFVSLPYSEGDWAGRSATR